MSRVYDHRFSARTTLGVGIAAPVVYAFADQPANYDDFCRMYARWQEGPVVPGSWEAQEVRQREHTLNWRVFGSAAPSLAQLDALGWYPSPRQPLGLWRIASVDMSGLPAWVKEDGGLLNALLQTAKAAMVQMGERVYSSTLALADVSLPQGVHPREWGKLLRMLRPEAMAERVLAEIWARNVVTDNGATALLKNLWNSAGSTVAIMNHLVIAQLNQAYAIQTGAAINNASGAQTSITVGGGVQATNFPVSGPITWSYGTTNAETWTTGSSAPGNLGATSITVVSQTTVSGHTHSAGDYVVNNPSTSDNPASVSNSADSGALPGGDFTFSGTGAGNRQVQIQFTFSTSTAAGSYTEAYLSNAGTIASNSTSVHLIFPPQVINSNTSAQFTITEKL